MYISHKKTKYCSKITREEANQSLLVVKYFKKRTKNFAN